MLKSPVCREEQCSGVCVAVSLYKVSQIQSVEQTPSLSPLFQEWSADVPKKVPHQAWQDLRRPKNSSEPDQSMPWARWAEQNLKEGSQDIWSGHSGSGPEPVQVGRTDLTPEECQLRCQDNLPPYCGPAGHFIFHCPVRAWAHQLSQEFTPSSRTFITGKRCTDPG